MAVQFKPRSNKQGFVDTTADLATISGRENYTVLVKDYGIFEWLGAGTANSIDVFPGLTGVWSLVTSSAPAGNVAVKTYKALITQSGTDAPVATVLENSLGGTPVWARSNAGTYTITLNGAFTVGKTLIFTTLHANNSEGRILVDLNYSGSPNANTRGFVIQNATTNTNADTLAANSCIEILVYP
jgi:hypothetical protein